MTPVTLLCDCLGSQRIDGPALEQATGRRCSRVHTFLCGDELDAAARGMEAGPVTIACHQESARFRALADELGHPEPGFVDLRDRAGWTDDPRSVTPKQAALMAEAAMPLPAARSIDVVSHGTCLVIGDAETGIPAAARLAETLAVTLLLTDGAAPPESRAFDTIHGRIRSATGALGRFRVTIDALSQVIPGGRGGLAMTAPRDGGRSDCDLIVDLSGTAPLFPAHLKREGYLRADPRSPQAVADATRQAAGTVGTFEQPLHVRLEPALCAHSRAAQTGCTRCIDACPTGALTPDGDHVAVDPHVCAGCGACSALCPSGAIAFDAPPVETVFRRLNLLAETYRRAGGTDPRLLVYDGDEGREAIALNARHGRGLPADVIAFQMPALSAFGHAEALAALASGFSDIALLLSRATGRETPEHEAALVASIAGPDRFRLVDLTDPEALPDALGPNPGEPCAPVLPMGTRRQITRLAAKALSASELLALPEGAPYGAVLVDRAACTLCLSCVSLCPSGALGDNPDLPQLLFQEDACLQCGLCATICPEDAITLEPRLNLGTEALGQVVLNEEEPFACIDCGALFGVRSTVEKVVETLAGKHAMFARPEAARIIQMCETCRVAAQYHDETSPLGAGRRARPRTAEDYRPNGKEH